MAKANNIKRRNYVGIAFDGKVQFVGTLKDGTEFYYINMNNYHGFSHKPFSYNLLAMAEHAIETKFFTYKAELQEWANTYSIDNPSETLQAVTNCAAIVEGLVNSNR